MKRGLVYLCMVGLTVMLVACGKKVPKEVIQPQEMEDLLYDYHLASAMNNDVAGGHSIDKQAYLDFVFQKHGVTEAQFDSSMVWYTRHTDYLQDIYARLTNRFEQIETNLKRSMSRKSEEMTVSMSGDSVNVWQDRSIYLLTHGVFTDRIRFDLKTDTTFKPKDALVLSADFTPLLPKGNNFTAVMGLSLQFSNDSVVGRTLNVTSSGHQELRVETDSAYTFKSVSGFVYFVKPGAFNGEKLLLSEIRLHRYHRKETVQPIVADSTSIPAKQDSLVSDSVK